MASRSTPNRPHVVAVRLTDAEVAYMDASRGSLKRSMWLRKLLVDAKRRDTAV
jgi:hypothetical protein